MRIKIIDNFNKSLTLHYLTRQNNIQYEKFKTIQAESVAFTAFH